MTIQIAEFTVADCHDVLAFWQKQEGISLDDADTPNALGAYLSRNVGMSLLARDDGQVVAAILCGHDGRRGYLHHLAVASSCRGQGIGRLLVERCIERLRQAGILKCNIVLFADNAKGEKFWTAVGFKQRDDLKLMQRRT